MFSCASTTTICSLRQWDDSLEFLVAVLIIHMLRIFLITDSSMIGLKFALLVLRAFERGKVSFYGFPLVFPRVLHCY